jgi:small subunit ribosomal protein S9
MPEDPQQPDEPREDASQPEEPQVPPAGVAAESGTDEPEGQGAQEDGAAEQGTDAPEGQGAQEDSAAERGTDAPSAQAGGVEEAAAEEPAAVDDEAAGVEGDDAVPRVRPEIPGADLEPDIVLEGSDPLGGRAKPEIPGADLEPDIVAEDEDELLGLEPGEQDAGEPPSEDEEPRAITQAAIDLAAGARYRATGKRKTSIARVILRPGNGAYTINGRPLDAHFPRPTLQRTIRQPLETVGYHARMDVVATIQGGGVSGQAGALRHGIARALIEADPNLRAELKRRGFLTRDARVKERKKAGLKKARKRPQFSKR